MYSILGNYKALPNWYKNVSFVTQELDIKVKLIQLKMFVGKGRKPNNKEGTQQADSSSLYQTYCSIKTIEQAAFNNL